MPATSGKTWDGMRQRPRRLRRPGGFTLVELLVVIVIILLLIAIGIGMMRAIEDNAARSKTMLALRNAQMLTDEFFEISNGRIMKIEPDLSLYENPTFTSLDSDEDRFELEMRIKPASGPTPFEYQDNLYVVRPWKGSNLKKFKWDDGYLSGAAITAALGVKASDDSPRLRSSLSKVPDDVLYATEFPVPEFRDGWGNPLHYAAYVTDIRSILPKHNSPFWASAGPDGKWGDATDDIDGDGVSDDAGTWPDDDPLYNESYHREWAADNIYSFDLD